MKLMILWVQFSRYTWFDLGCPVIFRFIPRHSTLDTFIIISFLPEPWLLLCFYFFIFLFLFFYFFILYHFSMTNDLLPWLKDEDQSSCFLVKLSYIFELWVQHLPWWQGLTDYWLVCDNVFIFLVGMLCLGLLAFCT